MANETKTALLKMPFGTACGKLRKMLLFELARKLNMLNCHRCGQPITCVEDFSMEHKTEWQSAANPIAAFFDIASIVFSHLVCNSVAANKRRAVIGRPGYRIRHRPKRIAYMRRKRAEKSMRL
jgi:hypothetical protein